ncbi:urease accessory protein UreF [Tautonia marina]|uniref:urease accessory protein UreF n=1 Tax=Tautonia marina TaxID=2653855 RepID=UPI0036F3E1F8
MRVLQFGDSVLPVGAFSFSNGLESAVQLGIVQDTATLEQFIGTALHQAATSDGIAVLAAFRAARDDDLGRIVDADFAVANRKLNEEMRTMTVRMGRKLAEMAEHVLGPSVCSSWLAAIRRGDAPGCFPIGQALVFSSLGLSEQDAFAVHQYGLASMMVAASLRLMRLHYLDAQAILFRVNSEAEAHYKQIASASIDDMAAFAPVMDIVASAHVKATVRMFMN